MTTIMAACRCNALLHGGKYSHLTIESKEDLYDGMLPLKQRGYKQLAYLGSVDL